MIEFGPQLLATMLLIEKSICYIYCLCEQRVTKALKWVSKFCKIFVPDFSTNLLEVKSFYSHQSMLSKQKHSIWMFEKKKNSCLAVNQYGSCFGK